jgi:hypothetical protein
MFALKAFHPNCSENIPLISIFFKNITAQKAGRLNDKPCFAYTIFTITLRGILWKSPGYSIIPPEYRPTLTPLPTHVSLTCWMNVSNYTANDLLFISWAKC